MYAIKLLFTCTIVECVTNRLIKVHMYMAVREKFNVKIHATGSELMLCFFFFSHNSLNCGSEHAVESIVTSCVHACVFCIDQVVQWGGSGCIPVVPLLRRSGPTVQGRALHHQTGQLRRSVDL